MKNLTEGLAAKLVKSWEYRYNSGELSFEASMQAEILELRAALAERDAEIERLHAAMAGLQDMESSAQQKLAAQRKVLEQAGLGNLEDHHEQTS